MKFSVLYIAPHLSRIINVSFASGSVPDMLNIAKVCPIYKRGDKSVITNYRPISILPSFSKIYEKLWFTMVTVTIIISFRLLHIQSIDTIKLFSIHLIHINIYKYIYVGKSIYNSYFLNTFG